MPNLNDFIELAKRFWYGSQTSFIGYESVAAKAPPLPGSPTPPEKVLVFPAHLLTFEGVLTDSEEIAKVLQVVLNPANLLYIERDIAEKDFNFKQVIPYVLLMRNQHVFTYQRSKKGGESRLHSLWSVGVGGHINSGDPDYHSAFMRELQEEVGLTPKTQKIIALLNDNSNDVGKVHFGIVHAIPVEGTLAMNDPALANGHFQDSYEAYKNCEMFETWSKLVLTQVLQFDGVGILKRGA